MKNDTNFYEKSCNGKWYRLTQWQKVKGRFGDKALVVATGGNATGIGYRLVILVFGKHCSFTVRCFSRRQRCCKTLDQKIYLRIWFIFSNCIFWAMTDIFFESICHQVNWIYLSLFKTITLPLAIQRIKFRNDTVVLSIGRVGRWVSPLTLDSFNDIRLCGLKVGENWMLKLEPRILQKYLLLQRKEHPILQ